MKPTMQATNRHRLLEGFTLVEIMIVICVIGLLAAIAAPNFARSRRESQGVLCAQWLERIAGAKAQVAFAEKLRPSDTPTDAALIAYIHQDIIITALNGCSNLCPAGGTYTVNNISTNPTCTLDAGPGHHRIE
jgi:prepilin-type N-terminal cleavage/methylation domain-containing protein